MGDGRRRLVLTTVCCLVLLGVGTGSAAGASDYDLRIANDDQQAEIPEVSFTYEGDTYRFDSLGYVNDANIDVTTTVPSATTEGNIILRDPDGDLPTSIGYSGNETVTLDTGGIDPGTYGAILKDDYYKAVLPLVVSGYQFTTDKSRYTVDTTKDTASVTVTVQEDGLNLSASDSIEIGYYYNGTPVVVNESRIGDKTEYHFDLPVEATPPGDYTLYAAARGGDTVSFDDRSDQSERLAFQDVGTLTIKSDQSDPDSGDGGNDGIQEPVPPTAIISSANDSIPSEITVGDRAQFTANKSKPGAGQLNASTWWINGNITQNTSPVVTFNTTGVWNISLRVTNSYGYADTTSVNITVIENSSDGIIAPNPGSDSNDGQQSAALPISPAMPVIGLLLTVWLLFLRNQGA